MGAKTIGRNGSGYVLKNLQLNYGKLMKMNVEVPEGAKEVCPETMACPSLILSPSNKGSCEMPPPFEEDELKKFLEKKKNVEKEVEMWTNEYWEEQKKSLQH
ncbi:hypothetical protein Bca52824_049644 [Brassica carinata]|uniref:Glycosyl transferase CAP10 domain-containing protein n=1 Tax=Brassica carinata TaxID=52824 RepID=A0A8X7URY7_BRACI|nr:hypothetical protein Bca52824_049644 [Brassica carinata]